MFKFIADQVGRLADMLGLTGDKVGEFKEEQKKANDEIAKGVEKYSNMPPKIEDIKAVDSVSEETAYAIIQWFRDSFNKRILKMLDAQGFKID